MKKPECRRHCEMPDRFYKYHIPLLEWERAGFPKRKPRKEKKK